MITGWAVALTCCVSHSAKHRKRADFYPSRSQNPEPIIIIIITSNRLKAYTCQHLSAKTM